MPKPSDYLRKGWCQRHSAVDEQGYDTPATSPTATKWCVYGAIEAAYPHDMEKSMTLVQTLYIHMGTHLVARWNDEPGRTQKEAIALLEAIGE